MSMNTRLPIPSTADEQHAAFARRELEMAKIHLRDALSYTKGIKHEHLKAQVRGEIAEIEVDF